MSVSVIMLHLIYTQYRGFTCSLSHLTKKKKKNLEVGGNAM